MNEIVVINDASFDLNSIKTIEDVKAFLLKLETLEKLLKATDKWHENICKYCALEAQAYCRIADLGFDGFAKSNTMKFKIVQWLKTVDLESREKILAECFNDGISIVTIFRRDVLEPQKTQDMLEKLEWYQEDIIDDFKTKGIITISDYENKLEKVRGYLHPDLINAAIDSTRGKLRSLGGYGTGDNEGTYVDAEHASEYTDDVIQNRVKSITADLLKLRSLVRRLENDGHEILSFPLMIEKEHSRSPYLTSQSAVSVMLTVMGLTKCQFKGQSSLAELRT